MNKLFDSDSKLIYWANKLADLVLLQLLTLLCCLPVITAGASFTAMHKVLLQLRRDEESGVTKAFFRSFRSNLRQATIIWVFFILLFLALYLNWRILTDASSSATFRIVGYLFPIMFILAILSLNWIFVILSRYHNSIWGSLQTALLVGLSHPLYSFAMVLLMLLPPLALFLSIRTLPLVLLLGFTLPGYLQALMYSRVFDKLEEASRKQSDDIPEEAN